ncbi:MAG: hypothetical protein ACQEXJ_14170 [Myxococcota bacterium]
MNLDEVADGWLGPLLVSAQRRPDHEPARALFLGAGFTKSSYDGAPRFSDLVPEARRRLLDDGAPPFAAAEMLERIRSSRNERLDPSDLFETLEHHRGRVEVARAVLAEGQNDEWRLSERPIQQAVDPMPLDAEATFRTVHDWRRVIERGHTGLSPLDPGGSVAMVGRLVVEGVVDRLLTTNWDAYAELGCLLAGARLLDEGDGYGRDGDRLGDGQVSVRVYDRPADVHLQVRPAGTAAIIKLHGGVRNLLKILKGVKDGELTAWDAEEELRDGFLVATSDLGIWGQSAAWVADVVRESLLARRTLFLGVSFADGATFLEVRKRIGDWARAARQNLDRGVPGIATPTSLGPHVSNAGPPLYAVDFGLAPRVANALTVRVPLSRHGDRLHVHSAQGDGREALRRLFAHHLLRYLLRSLDPDVESDECVRGRLSSVLGRSERAVTLLCDVLAPASRWAAIAEGLPPFARLGGLPRRHPGARWWYRAWTTAQHHPGACETCANLRVIAYTLDRLLCRGSSIEVNPGEEWVHVSEVSGNGGQDKADCSSSASFWFWPWPWPRRRGLSSGHLWRTLAWFGSAPSTQGVFPHERSAWQVARAPSGPFDIVPLFAADTHSRWGETSIGGQSYGLASASEACHRISGERLPAIVPATCQLEREQRS